MVIYKDSEVIELLKNNGDKWGEYLLKLTALKSYGVKCPGCKETGIPFPKWKKGGKGRNVYFVHHVRSKIKRICEVPDNMLNGVNTTAALSEDDLLKLINFGKIFVLFSGGKDSLSTLLYINGLCDSIKKPFQAVFIDTTVGFPEVTQYVKRICTDLNIPLKLVKPKTDYYTLAKEWGIPNFKSRWCCRELKIKPVNDYLANLKGDKVVFDGIRAAESNDRAKYFPIWYHPGFDALSISPLFFWSNDDIDKYLNEHDPPRNPVEHLGSSCECWCGAYKKRSDFEKLFYLHPDIYEKLIDVEEANPRGFTFIYENGRRTSLKELKNKFSDNLSSNDRS